MERLLAYLQKTYAPLAVIVYGSYADGTQEAGSDFDALLVTRQHHTHDVSIVEGVQLDVFAYTLEEVSGEIDCDAFIQIHDGILLADTDGIGSRLQSRIQVYVSQQTDKTDEDISAEIAWCRKMLCRAGRADAEGLFRWHWLLMESLEIYCDARHQPYWGPKKTLRWLAKVYPDDYSVYMDALACFQLDKMAEWVECITKLERKNSSAC